MPNPNLKNIKNIVKEFFEKTTLDIEVDFIGQREDSLLVNLKTEKPRTLIGEGGWTLVEIQHLLNVIVRKKSEEPLFIDLDVSNYKKRKIEYLKELARSVADEVVLNKEERLLASMPAYERRVVHMELKEREDVITESMGKDPDRGVLIKPAK